MSIGAPGYEELATETISNGGTRVLNESLEDLGIPGHIIDAITLVF